MFSLALAFFYSDVIKSSKVGLVTLVSVVLQRKPTISNFHFHRAVFSSQLKSEVGNILAKSVALRIVLNIDGTPTIVFVTLEVNTSGRWYHDRLPHLKTHKGIYPFDLT